MVNIYIDEQLNFNIINYTFSELFRYIDIDFAITTEYEKSDIIYININNLKNKMQIIPSEMFWKNYKKPESLPDSPLLKKDDITYIYEDDIIASAFFMLSGYEEYLNPQRDKFNRFMYQYSYYRKDEIYTKPMVEQYREILIKRLNDIGIKCKRKNIWNNKEFGLFLTHDVDGVYKYRSILKSIVKIFLKPSKFSFKELVNSKINITKDPYFKGFEYLINQSDKFNFKSTFFFITRVREKLDDFYSINDKAIVDIMQKINENKFEIGLHGSLKSSEHKQYLKEEKELLSCTGIRQHYLKYDINSTSQNQERLFDYDSTLCFADIIGFRRGTCMPFRLYDLPSDTQLDLIEIPLIVMDQTLKGYMNLNPDDAYVKVVGLIDKIKQYNGLFTLLWHPGNCSDEWEEWLKDMYSKILIYMKKEHQESLVGSEIIKRVKND